jgi:hypothetical protein
MCGLCNDSDLRAPVHDLLVLLAVSILLQYITLARPLPSKSYSFQQKQNNLVTFSYAKTTQRPSLCQASQSPFLARKSNDN